MTEDDQAPPASGDIPGWLVKILKLIVPAYIVLALSVAGAFYVGFKYAGEERDRICAVVVEVTTAQVDALIAAATATEPDPPLTPEEEKARQDAIDSYRADVNEGLEKCPTGSEDAVLVLSTKE